MGLNTLRADMLRVYLDTSTTVPAEEQLRLAHAILNDLHKMDGVGPETVFSIHHLGHGSTLFEVICAGLGVVTSVGIFGITLSNHLRDNQGEAASQCSYIINNYGGSRVTISTADDEPITVHRDELPQLQQSQRRIGFGEAFADSSLPTDNSGLGPSGTDEGRKAADGSSVYDEGPSTPKPRHFDGYAKFYKDEDEGIVWADTSEGTVEVNNPEAIDNLALFDEYHVIGVLSDYPRTLKIEHLSPSCNSRKSHESLGKEASSSGKGQTSLDNWLSSGAPFPWSAPAVLYSVVHLSHGPPRRHAESKGGNANQVISMAMSNAFGRLEDLEVEIESGVLVLRGKEIARAAGLPDRPGSAGYLRR